MDQNQIVDQFADVKIIRFDVPGFENLSLDNKILVYYLSEAALAGRDILFDQHCSGNLTTRWVLEQMALQMPLKIRQSESFAHLLIYLKRVWFSSGIHHHYSTQKLEPGFKEADFIQWFEQCDWQDILTREQAELVRSKLLKLIYDPSFCSKRVSTDASGDLLHLSCNHFYVNTSQQEAESYYRQLKSEHPDSPPSYGLNSCLVNENGILREHLWKSGGMYGAAIDQIIFWLSKAALATPVQTQQRAIRLLIDFYKEGDVKLFDEFNIQWLKDNDLSVIDFINGFIEVYGDPLGIKGSWEALVEIIDRNETNKIKVISDHAQWFEDHSPIDLRFKKEKVTGVTMKQIHAVMLGGDCYPASPLGINLPNADWIREKHGSKSVSLSNISDAHHRLSITSGVIEEFAWSETEIRLHHNHGVTADHLHTHLHECLGHGSGKMMPEITSEMLKSYSSVIEETRADLFGLYFMMDEKLIELGLIDTTDVAVCHYNAYIRNGLMVQLTRIKEGHDIEQAHMRNRQLICKWVLEKGGNKVIMRHQKNGKTYFEVIDHQALRQLFGQLLQEVQRIKSTGDYHSARELVERYGVHVDPELHKEILERYRRLQIPPFTGFVNPVLKPVYHKDGRIADILIDYQESYMEQMFRYSHDYGFLVKESIHHFLNQ